MSREKAARRYATAHPLLDLPPGLLYPGSTITARPLSLNCEAEEK